MQATHPEPKFVALSRQQAMEIHLLGRALYGSVTEWDQHRPRLLLYVTKNRSAHTNFLSTVEAAKLISSLEREIKKQYKLAAHPLQEYPTLLADVEQLQGRALAESFQQLRSRLTMDAIPDLLSLDEIPA